MNTKKCFSLKVIMTGKYLFLLILLCFTIMHCDDPVSSNGGSTPNSQTRDDRNEIYDDRSTDSNDQLPANVSAPSTISNTTYNFYTSYTTQIQFRPNGYGTMYTSAGSSGIIYQYVKGSNGQAAVRVWQYFYGEGIRNDIYDDFVMTFEDTYSGTCVHAGSSSLGTYGPIQGTFERIQ